MNSCSSMSGIVYKFKYQNILSFEDNVKFMGGVYFAIYCNFATICRKTSMIFQKTFQCIQSPMPLLLSLTQTLGLKKFSVRSFNHTFDQLNEVGYLSSEILHYFDPITTRQHREYSEFFVKKKKKFSLGERF